jgi:hypothetical protein
MKAIPVRDKNRASKNSYGASAPKLLVDVADPLVEFFRLKRSVAHERLEIDHAVSTASIAVVMSELNRT